MSQKSSHVGRGLAFIAVCAGIGAALFGWSNVPTTPMAGNSVATEYSGGGTDAERQADAVESVADNLEAMADEPTVDASTEPTGDLNKAFKAAFGTSASANVTMDGEAGKTDYTFKPVALLWPTRGPVLVSVASDDGAPQWNKVAIHYLNTSAGEFVAEHGWLNVGSAGSSPTLSAKFSQFPVLYSEGLAVGAGGSESFFELVELRPDGPHLLGSFNDGGGADGPRGKFGSITTTGFDLVCPPSTGGQTIHYRRVADSYVSELKADYGCSE